MDAWRYGLIIAGWRKCCDTFLRRGSNPPPPVGGKRLPSPGPPWRVPDKQRQDRQERHESAGDAVATATLAPLTADEVRKIVREEIERAREIPKQEPS